MDCHKVRVLEVIAVKSPQPLRSICTILQTRFGMPDFSFAAEPEGEWATSVLAGIECCVSRPHQPIVWPEAATQLGSDCNIGVALIVEGEDADQERQLKDWTPRVAQALADALGEPVIHHLTWRPDRIMDLHEQVYDPAPVP